MSRFIVIIMLVAGLFSCSPPEVKQENMNAPFLDGDLSWADSLVLSMSLDEKIGQLLVYQTAVADSQEIEDLKSIVAANRVGGLVLEEFQLYEFLQLINELQSTAKVPLFNGSRQQVSLNNQFADLTHLPNPATISSIVDDTLRQRISTNYIEQLKNLGFNLCFTPNLNSNVDREGFDFMTYESDSLMLLQYSEKILRAIQQQHMLSFAGDFKDFVDRSLDTLTPIDSLLLRYQHAVWNGVSGFYVDQRLFQIDTLAALPPYFLQQYLREEIDFDGLLIADWEAEPFNHMVYAGVDLFVVRDSFEERFAKVKDLVAQEIISEPALNEKVRKILQAKSWMGLDTLQNAVNEELALDVMSQGFDDYEVRQMYERALTLVNNPEDHLPFSGVYGARYKIIRLGKHELEDFQANFSRYADYSLVQQPLIESGGYAPLKRSGLHRTNLVIALADVNLHPQEDSLFLESVNDLATSVPIQIVNFGNPKNLLHFDTTVALVQQYEVNSLTEAFAAQFLFGGLQAKGKLPLELSERYPYRHGIDDTPVIRLKYTVPEEVGIAAYQLVGIDALARKAIREKATPGCQILVAKEGKVIYDKSFGRHTYRNGRAVRPSDLYDLASVTKVAATTLGIMKLYDEQKIQLKQPLKSAIEVPKKSRLRKIKIRELLTHRSGLQSNMPIARYILDKDSTGVNCTGPFCKEKTKLYPIAVADSFYMNPNYIDSIWQEVFDIKPYKRKRYRYSDVNFNLLMRIVEERSGMTLDDYLNRNFYRPLNLDRLTYTPKLKFKAKELVPTAEEYRFRKQLIHGHVHDESAALLGGVAGNAGLFGNTASLAPLLQMLLNRGTYGGKHYLQPKTVDLFTKQQRNSSRGYGFAVKTKRGTNACAEAASDATYGHTGFTGTCVWVDPDQELIYIFLSNRVYPEVSNRKLFKDKVRKKIHALVYEALGTYPEKGVDELLSEETPLVRAAVK